MFITREELALRWIAFEKSYPVGQFDFPERGLSTISPVLAKGTVELAGADIRIRGHIATRVGAACDRCTAPVEFPIEQSFDVIYRPVSSIATNEEIEVPSDELDVGFYPGDGINLADVVKEQLILALPMKLLCRPDCRGLCPACGADLNTGSCYCHERKSASAFASLLKSG